MRSFLFPLVALLLVFSLTSEALAQRRSSSSRSHYGSSRSTYVPKYKTFSPPKSPTYDLGGTRYKLGQSYKSTGMPKVDRSSSAKQQFLNSQGLKKAPAGYEVDHIVPLSKGGVDRPSNMQLLPKETHKQKTASERKKH